MTSPNVASAGAVALDVEPNADQFYPRLRAQVVPAAEQVGRDIAKAIAGPIVNDLAESITRGIRDGGRGSAQAEAVKTGNGIGDNIGRAIKTRVQAAVASLPEVRIDGDTSGLQRKLDQVRGQVMSLRDVNLRVDADTAAAETALEFVTLQARELAGMSPTIRVELAGATDVENELAFLTLQAEELAKLSPTIRVSATGTRSVISQLSEVFAFAEALGTIDINIHVEVDDAGALSNMAILAAAALALGRAEPTITPNVNPVPALTGLAAIFTASTLATIGINALAVSGGLLVTILVPAAAAAAVAVAAIGPAAILGLAGIGVLAFGLSGVIAAITKLNSAQDKAAGGGKSLASSQNQIASAVAGVESAERALANTRAQNADADVRSKQRVEDAERALARAERDTLAAEQALTAARKTARQAAEDLANSVIDAGLQQRQATAALVKAREEQDRINHNPLSTDADKAGAQLAVEQAVQGLAEIELRQKRLTEQKAVSDKAGIEGSTQVKAAQTKIADALDRQQAAARAVTAAERDRVTQQRQAQFALAGAIAGVANAERGVAQAHASAGAAGLKAAAATKSALAGLSGPERDFVHFIMSIKDQFTGLRAAAAGGFLPGLTAGIKALLPILPAVKTFLGQVGKALGDLFERGGKALASPFWLNFFKMLGSMAGPVMRDFGTILGSLVKGLVSLFIAFAPMTTKVTGGLAKMATGFATWAASISKSEGFKQFIAYVVANAPALLSTLGSLAVIAVRLGIMLAPLGAIVLRIVAAFLKWLASLPPSTFTAIAIAVGAVVTAIGFLTGSFLAIVIGVALLVGGLVYAYTHFKTFRAIVDAVWHAIAAGAVWLWQVVLKPTFDFIVGAAIAVGHYFTALYQKYVKPVFDQIGAVVSLWWHQVAKPVFGAVVAFIKGILAPWFAFLYKNVVHPYFKAIGVVISVAWAIIKVVFGLIQIAVKILAAVFWALYSVTIKPVVDLFIAAIALAWRITKPVFEALGNFITDHVAPTFQRGLNIISRIWAKVRDIAKVPIKFVLETVLNNGLLAGYNKIAKMFNVKPDNVQVPIPAGFATGGPVRGQGGPTSDSILARLSNGEYVIPANIVSMFGVGFFDWLIGKSPFGGKAVRPGDGSEGLAFAKGGAVPGFAEGGFVGRLKGLWNNLKDPLGWVKEQAGKIIDAIPGARYLVNTLSGIGHHLLDGVVAWLKGKITNTSNGGYQGPVSADVASVQQWVQAQAGKPYIWTGVGPAGFDCSGAVGAVYRLLHGQTPNARSFSTANEDGFFPKLNQWGVLTAGWAHPGQRGASPGVGHTAGNLAGLGFESRGGDGFVVGNNATKVTDFAHFGTYDSGGWLMPGLTVAYNGTGRPESIRTAEQEAALRSQLVGQGGPQRVTNIYPKQAVFDERALAAHNAAEDTRMRIGRPV